MLQQMAAESLRCRAVRQVLKVLLCSAAPYRFTCSQQRRQRDRDLRLEQLNSMRFANCVVFEGAREDRSPAAAVGLPRLLRSVGCGQIGKSATVHPEHRGDQVTGLSARVLAAGFACTCSDVFKSYNRSGHCPGAEG